MNSYDIFVLIFGSCGFIFCSAVLYLIAKNGAILRGKGKEPITAQKNPVIYWAFIGWSLLGLIIMALGLVVVATRLFDRT